MEFIGWMYDIAREQSPGNDQLIELVRRSGAAGYGALGLYLEHRFAYPSAPWAADAGALAGEDVRAVAQYARGVGLRVIPFLNTLGHMEGFLRSEGGQRYAEDPGRNGLLQICPSRQECVDLVYGLVDDALAAFDDEWVHLGGDEAWQLGKCPACSARAGQIGTAGLFAEHYRLLCRHVMQRGRRPALWGDMLIAEPAALDAIPRETIIFDWHYSGPPRASTEKFRAAGFDVVCCPSVRSYDSGWCHLGASQTNIDAHAADAAELGALGVLVTTWECACFSAYASLWPVIMAAGRRLARGEDWTAALQAEGGAGYAAAAELLGDALPSKSQFLAPGPWRLLRDRFVIQQDPFLLWQAWRDDAVGRPGDEILALCDEAAGFVSADDPLQLPIALHRVAVEWVRCVERARRAYANGELSAAVEQLEDGGRRLETLRPGLMQALAGGGSRGDLHRLDRLQRRVGTIVERLRDLPVGAPCRPAFETLLHERFVPGEQAGWLTGQPLGGNG